MANPSALTAVRPAFVWIHRWVGLVMAAFLAIEGLTGSMLAFRGPLTRFFDPGLYSRPHDPSARQLDLATLIEVSEKREPMAKFHWFLPMGDGLALVAMVPRHGANGGGNGHEGLYYLALNPWTGGEVRRMNGGLYSDGLLPNVMPFVYELHKALALGKIGGWILCITALLWTIDCFAGIYLTFPRTLKSFWPRWKPAWLIKAQARPPRVNMDVHRSLGLWLWLVLLPFAWSSVALVDNFSVYNTFTDSVFGPSSLVDGPPAISRPGPPRLDWHAAFARGRSLAAQAGVQGGFVVGKPDSFWFGDNGLYTLRLDTSRRFPEYRALIVSFEGDTGIPVKPWGLPDPNANAIFTDWLVGFHMIGDPFDYNAYRWFVVFLGLALTAVSVTGVLAWFYKRRGRMFQQRRTTQEAGAHR
jgi:uncharacterized iron-regulated membrane protein